MQYQLYHYTIMSAGSASKQQVASFSSVLFCGKMVKLVVTGTCYANPKRPKGALPSHKFTDGAALRYALSWICNELFVCTIGCFQKSGYPHIIQHFDRYILVLQTRANGYRSFLGNTKLSHWEYHLHNSYLDVGRICDSCLASGLEPLKNLAYYWGISPGNSKALSQFCLHQHIHHVQWTRGCPLQNWGNVQQDPPCFSDQNLRRLFL